MNIKMTINSQLSTTESRKQKQTKQTTRIETESWKSFGKLSGGGGREKMREKIQVLRSIIGRYKIDRGILRIA